MNYSIIRFIIGRVLCFEAAFMILPCITAVIYQEKKRMVLCDKRPFVSGCGFSAFQKKAFEYGLLCTGGIRYSCSLLDYDKYHGGTALFDQRFYHESF